MDVYRTGANWTASSATWNSSSSSTYSGAVLLSSTRVGNKGWYEFDITEAYNYWLRPGMSNYGLLFKMRVESASENYWRQFASAAYSDSSKLPYITVVYDEPVSIDINPESIRLYVNETFQPAVRANPAGAALGTAYWSSSNTGVVTVNSTTGKMTAVSSGTAVITVSIYTGTSTATGSCSVSVFSGTPPVKTDTVYHIFNANSTKPVSPREGNLTDGGQVWQEGYRPENAYYQKWKAIRLFNGYYVLRSEQSPNLALSGLGDSLQLKDIGSSNSYSDVPTHAQWNITGSAGSGLRMTVRSSGKSICIQNNAVWSGENILVGSTGSKSREFLFIEPSRYVPTTGVTLQDPIYIMKNGSYICMPQITPANATFKRVIWSWEERGNTTDTGITMSDYAWGESTASYTGTVVTGKKEGVYWLRAYCADTNYSDTVDVDVHFISEGWSNIVNRGTQKYIDINNQSTEINATAVQWDANNQNSQLFYISRDAVTGKIRFKNMKSNYYLSVENNSYEQDALIRQMPYNKASIGQQFDIVATDNNAVKIIPMTGSGLSPQKVVAVGHYLLNSNGVAIKQRSYDDPNIPNYVDEWFIINLKNSVNVIYDYGYTLRFSNYKQRMVESLERVRYNFMNRFGIIIDFNISTTPFQSIADTCPTANGGAEKIMYNNLCTCGNFTNDCYNIHHKNAYKYYDSIPTPNISLNTTLCFTGHIVCNINNGLHQTSILGLGAESGKVVIFDRNDSGINALSALISHELGHLYGLAHHDDLAVYPNQKIFYDQPDCVMGGNGNASDDDMEQLNQDLTYCNICTEKIIANSKRFKHN